MKQGAVARLRTSCKANETTLDPAEIGIQGPEGPPGPEGPAGPAGPEVTGSTLRFVAADGTPAENGAALVAALAAFMDASAAKPYTVHLAPGVYDVGSAGLDLVPFVDLEGSGRERTIVTGSGSSDANPFDGGPFGTIRTADATTLRALTVRNTGGAGTTALGVYVGAGRSRLQDVVVDVSGGSSTVGVAPLVPGSEDIFIDIVDSDLVVVNGAGMGRLQVLPRLAGLLVKDSRIVVSGGGSGVVGDMDVGGSYVLDAVSISVTGGGVGVSITGEFEEGAQLVRNSVIAVTGGNSATGLAGAGSGFRPVVENTRVQVADASTANVGIATNNGAPGVLASRIVVSGAGATALRIGSTAFAGTAEVIGSILKATTVLESFQNNAGTTFRVGASQLVGTTLTTGTGSFVCVNSFSSAFTALSGSCS